MHAMQGSAEPEAPGAGPASAGGEGGVMGMNPLVGHKVDRYWAEVLAHSFTQTLLAAS